jgi:gliding motility-associated-like protein
MTKRFKYVFIVLLVPMLACFSTSIMAQRVDWAGGWGNTKSDKATTVKTDDSGYIYVCGYFSNKITLGTNNILVNYVGSSSSKEVYIAKFDSTYKCIWAKAAGNGFDDRALGMDVDSAGNVTITGTYWSSNINFDGNLLNGSGGGDECFVVHYNTNGVYQWGHTISSDGGDDQGLDLATDKWGNHYVVGFMSGTNLDVTGNGITAVNANDIYGAGGWNQRNCFWLAKLDKNGVAKWARTFARQPYDGMPKYVERDIAVTVDDSGGIYVGGGYEKFTTFNNVKDTAKGGYDLFVLKYDSAGNFQWVTKGGSSKDDWINGITYDNMGHIYIVGEHRDSLIIDTILIKNYNRRDAFVAKLDAKSGKPIWGKRAGSNQGGERANDVYADANCNVYIAGDIQGGAKFNDNLYAAPGNSVQSFVARMTPEGKFLWAFTGGGADSNDRCNSVTKGNGAQVYACGFHRLPATFGSTVLSTQGSSDAYVLRLHDSMYNKSTSFKFVGLTDSIICPGGNTYISIPPHKAININPAVDIEYNADTSVITFKPQVTTTYTLTGYDGDLCISYDTIIFTITIAPLPTASIVATPSTAVLVDSIPVLFTSNAPLAANYLWSDDYGFLANSTDLNQTYYRDSNDFGTFCVYLKTTSTEGCIAFDTACVTMNKPEKTSVPNAFTPNGDIYNEQFRPVFTYTDLTKFRSYSLQIYDRYGTFLFESIDPNKGWRGKYPNGEDAEVGTYMYIIKFIDGSAQPQFYSGSLQLLR